MRPNPIYYQDLSENNRRIEDGESRIYYSEGYQHYSENAFRAISIKVPLTGVLHYRSAQHLVELHPGSMLLTCRQPGRAFFDEELPVRSICIDINEQLFSTALSKFFSKNDTVENFLPSYFKTPHEFWNTYYVKGSLLESSLFTILSAIRDGRTDSFDESIFHALSVQVIEQEYATVKVLKNLRSVKFSTKKEILLRLQKAKKHMDDHFLENPEIADIAAIANFSQFHFLRSFKQAFGITPYQYLLSKRLAHAKMLMEKNSSVIRAARHCNFTDIFSFSKSFKKHYGFPPSLARGNGG